MLRWSRREFALRLLAAAGFTTSGCGTLLYPERRGQPKGQLDWGVVLLDGLCLLLFVVPGVVAFAVDFGSGAIYLPSGAVEGYSGADQGTEPEFVELHLPPDELTDERIEAAVSQRLCRQVSLAEPRCRRERLRDLTQFRPVRDRVLAELSNQRNTTSPAVLRAQSR